MQIYQWLKFIDLAIDFIRQNKPLTAQALPDNKKPRNGSYHYRAYLNESNNQCLQDADVGITNKFVAILPIRVGFYQTKSSHRPVNGNCGFVATIV